jgi:2-dehydropantoate 2-reductase
MRVLIAGAGAVGGYFGAMLMRRGAEVAFLARGPHSEAMATDGLFIDSAKHESFSLHPKVFTTLADAGGPFDLILVAVKCSSLDPLARDLAARKAELLAPDGAVVPLQNGVESEALLSQWLGPTCIVGGVAHVGVEVVAPGRIRHTTRGDLLVGPIPGADRALARRVAELLAAHGLPGGYHDDLPFIAWRKLVWNSAFNAVTALTDATIGSAATHPQLRELLRSAMAETVRVAAAEGIALPDDLVDVWLAVGVEYGQVRTSMHQDVLAGRPTEHDALNGVVCRLGRKHGLATPVQDVLFALLDGRDAMVSSR